MKMRIISALLGIGISLMLALSDASAATTAAQRQAAARKAQQQQAAQQAQMRKILQQQQAQQRAYMAYQQKLYQAQQKAYQAQQKAYQAQQQKAYQAQQQKEAAAKKQAADQQAKVQKDAKTKAGATKATSSKRIEQDVNKGYLASDEVAKLDKQQAAIVKLQKQFAADGTVGKDDAVQLRGVVKDTSLAIWVQKHDVEGGQKPAFRLGENLRLNPDVAAKLGDENLSTASARKILTDFHAFCQDKKQLNGDLADAERAKLQKQYDDRLNQYFALK